MDDLYARLKPPVPALAAADRAALRRSLFGTAETARLTPVHGTTVRLVPQSPRRPPGALATAAALVGVVGLGGLLAVERGDVPAGPAATTAPPTTWRPAGEEVPLADLGPARNAPAAVTLASQVRRVSVEGHPPIDVGPAVMYMSESTAVEMSCISSRAGGGCTPEWYPGPSVAVSSAVDNGVGTFDLWIWDNVPVDAAFVEYRDGGTVAWQQPVAGLAAFPDVPGSDEVVVAYAVDGTELARVDDGVRALLDTAGSDREFYDVTPEQIQELNDLTTDTMTACLVERGGVIERGLTTFPDDVDDVATWDECIVVTKDVVGTRVAEIAPPLQP